MTDFPPDLGLSLALEETLLREPEAAMILAAKDLLNGRATKGQRETLLSCSADYESALVSAAQNCVEQSITMALPEEDNHRQLVELLSDSVCRIIQEAAYDHYNDSVFERTRFFLQQTKSRRVLGGIAISGAGSGMTYGAAKAAEMMPLVGGMSSLGVGLGVFAYVIKGLKPHDLLKSVLKSPADRISSQAKGGIIRYDLVELKKALEGIQEIQNKEVARRKSYQRITERFYLDMIRSALWPVVEQESTRQESIVKDAAQTTTSWLLAFYGIKKTEDEQP